MINSNTLKAQFLGFFKSKNHEIIPGAPLIPERDRTVLFTTAGMHPLVPFLIGEPHPLGKRLADVQKCLRTDDIFDIGDDSHLTFFEMLGSWSLGDYFKKESIQWSFEFLTSEKWLGIDRQLIFITVFSGDDDAPRDEESASIWRSVGVPPERISYLPKKDNWWGPAGETGPCGPDTEMFYDTGIEPCEVDCKPGCPCGKYVEIWNNVFMQYNKTSEGRYELLEQKNVDTGMGVERTVTCLNHMKSVYEIDTFKPIIEKTIEIAKIQQPLQGNQERSLRIIADHVKASTFILAEKIEPSNVERGYILRRLLRRTIRHGKLLGIEKEFLTDLMRVVIDIYKIDYPYLEQSTEFILNETVKEESKFRSTINRGLRKFNRIIEEKKQINGNDAFLLFQSFGFPIEMTKELASEKGIVIDESAFEKEFKAHQETSRIGAEKRFKANP